jgi:hypothetical protein
MLFFPGNALTFILSVTFRTLIFECQFPAHTGVKKNPIVKISKTSIKL